jgi:Cu/Zn superoxide dismutase
MQRRFVRGIKMIRALLAVGLLTALVAGSAWAQGAESQMLELTPSRDSGVSGTATLTEVGGQLQVQLNAQGLPEDGVEHIAHIHTDASCADDRADQGGPVEFPLEDVVAQGNAGSSTTTLDTTLSDLSDGTERYVNVHAENTGEGVPPGVACADLAFGGMQGGEQTMMESTEPLPKSGGVAPSALLPAAALILGSGILAFAVLRRR